MRETLRAVKSAVLTAINPLRPDVTGVFANYRPSDLKALDRQYRAMFSAHADVHELALKNLAAAGCRTIAEIACGSGHLAPLAHKLGLKYTGIDISETATSVACLKNGFGDFINLPADRLDILKDQSFDAVYNSSMLEHIGFHEKAIRGMWRLAAKRMSIMFYEGLSDVPASDIRFIPYVVGATPRESGGYYGEKVARQDHGERANGSSGYFLNKFSRSQIDLLLRDLGHVEIENFGGRTVATVTRAGAV